MLNKHDSPTLASIFSLSFALLAALLVAVYFWSSLENGRSLLVVLSMVLAFAAVIMGMFSISTPEPGMGLSLIGMGLGVGVIVIGFLAFLLNLARS